MKIRYRNDKLEKVQVSFNAIAATITVFTFVALFGFKKPLFDTVILYSAQISLFIYFIIEKIIRYFNTTEKKAFLKTNWTQFPLLLIFAVIIFSAGKWLFPTSATLTRHIAVGIYIFLQVVEKVCRTGVNIAATGKNPTGTLVASFIILIISGASLLMLPMSWNTEQISFTDALFTATSATCVTGLTVKDTGSDFSLVGQVIIISLVQLGGLGIVIFGAVIALLLGQALGISETAAMQDLLSETTIGKISRIIVFIFIVTFVFELIGTFSLLNMWNPDDINAVHGKWFCSIFHSISAFCNAGFSLFPDSLIRYNRNHEVYTVFCPLIIIGGLGFSVLLDLFSIAIFKTKRLWRSRFGIKGQLFSEPPILMRLQTKIVLLATVVLIISGTFSTLFFGRFTGNTQIDLPAAFFQSVTARTAGFNTIDIGQMSEVNRLAMMILMFIGGSPGSTAGGIKTVTLVIIIMTVFASMRKREEVELFGRSIKTVIVGRAVTVAIFFAFFLTTTIFALSVTESPSSFTLNQIAFEATSAMATVGLTTGITPLLSTAGKLIITATMLIGRLGPLTLVAALTFSLKPVKYNYPDETVVVG